MTNNNISKLKAASRTHPGQVRKINEDSIFSFVRDPEMGDPIALLIVADGIGGHKAGDIASNLAVQTVFNELAWFLDEDGSEQTKPLTLAPDMAEAALNFENYLETRLRMAIEDANLKIHEYAGSHPEQASNMGTTFSCLLIFNNRLVVAHIGDSRAYRLRDNTLEQLTDDHSFVGQMVRDGQLPNEAYYVHPRRNVITRALGQFAEVKVDMLSQDLQAGDRFLICSDRLWEMIRDPELEEHMRDISDMDATVEMLIELAVERGGPDNISVVIAEAE